MFALGPTLEVVRKQKGVGFLSGQFQGCLDVLFVFPDAIASPQPFVAAVFKL